MQHIRTIVALVAFAVWTALYLRAFFDPEFKAPPEVIPVVLIAVGFLLGSKVISIGGGGKDKANGDG
jgi:hypothetical protein